MSSHISRSFHFMTSFLYLYMIHPCMEMCKTIIKPRQYNLRCLLFLQIFIYALYWFALNENSTQYLYMLKVFDGFNGAAYAHFNIVNRIFGKYRLSFIIFSNFFYIRMSLHYIYIIAVEIIFCIAAIGNLFIMMPIMSKKLKLSEPMMIVVILSLETISHFSSVFVTELWQFYLTQIVGACMICKFSVARSMLSKVRSILKFNSVFTFTISLI